MIPFFRFIVLTFTTFHRTAMRGNVYDRANCNKMINIFVKYTQHSLYLCRKAPRILSAATQRESRAHTHERGHKNKNHFGIRVKFRFSQVCNRYRKIALKSPFILNSLGLNLVRSHARVFVIFFHLF